MKAETLCELEGCQHEAKYECEHCNRMVCHVHGKAVYPARGWSRRHQCAECRGFKQED